MAPYALAVFSSAFLLFEVQPLLGKYILPWFGGAPAVWTGCLLGFQVLLLAGYAYAYLSARYLPPRGQVILHLAMLLAALMLPIAPDVRWKSQALSDPTFQVLWLIAIWLGLPFMLLSATAPLLQHWFSLSGRVNSPYRLYALSNLGSQLALLSYPLLIEPLIGRAAQVRFWRAGLVLFGLSCAWTGTRVWNARRLPSAETTAAAAKPTVADQVLWVLLAGCGSLLLAAITNKLCQDLAPIALLWVLPLSAYLLSFILCFNGVGLYRRRWFAPLWLAALVAMVLTLSGTLDLSARIQAVLLLGGLFICCMVCHGELFRIRPAPIHLTFFYLMIALGSALGSFFVAILAPRIFSDYFELHCGLLLCAGLAALSWRRAWTGASQFRWRRVLRPAIPLALAGLGLELWTAAGQNDPSRIFRFRDFYGVLSVYRHSTTNPANSMLELVHGQVAHGVQFLQPGRAQTPTLYYTADSGVGRAFALLSQRVGRHIGVVGLGAGTLAAYTRPGDQITFYEINPSVKMIAQTYFTFLRACAGRARVQLDDARLSLEHEPPQNFDLLVLDAFNSDSIPLHLLTREAFSVYLRHTKQEGLIAVHVSNISLNLEPVVFNLAKSFGWSAHVMDQPRSDESQGLLPSTWILLSRDPEFENALGTGPNGRPSAPTPFRGPLWTDDYTSLIPVMRWGNHPANPSAAASPELASLGAQPSKPALAIAQLRLEIALHPESTLALNNLACVLATASDPRLRNGPEAVKLAERACALTQSQNISVLSTLAAAYAEAGRFDDAIATSERACALATERGETAMVEGNHQMQACFRHRRPFHQPGP